MYWHLQHFSVLFDLFEADHHHFLADTRSTDTNSVSISASIIHNCTKCQVTRSEGCSPEKDFSPQVVPDTVEVLLIEQNFTDGPVKGAVGQV